MSEITINSARYADPSNSLIDINLTRGGETFDFTLAADDPADLAVQLRAMMAENPVAIDAYVAPAASVPQSDFAVGTLLTLFYGGTNVTNGSTIAGSSLLNWTWDSAVGNSVFAAGLSGTWKNVSGQTLGYSTGKQVGYWVRTA